MSCMVRRRWPGTTRLDRSVADPRGPGRHGVVPRGDRWELEQAGWRTTLEYRENLVRGGGGRLREVQVEWRAEAERDVLGGGGPVVVWARGSTIDKVWARLRRQAAVVDGSARATGVDGAGSPSRPRAASVAPAAPAPV
jgi:hypothetical protein